MKRFAPAALILLAACARSEEASLLPIDDPIYNSVEQVRTPEGDDQEVALGQWRESLQEEVRVLEFGPNGTQPLFSLRCDERQGVLFQRHGLAPAGDLQLMIVTIGNETRRFAVTSVSGATPILRAAVPASDPLIQPLISASEPIVIRLGDAAPLVLPHGSEVGAFVRGCQQPAAARAALTAPAEGNSSAAATENTADAAPSNAAAPAAPSR